MRAIYAGVSLARIWGGTLPFFCVFVLRHAERWEFVVMRRESLRTLRADLEAAEQAGTSASRLFTAAIRCTSKSFLTTPQ